MADTPPTPIAAAAEEHPISGDDIFARTPAQITPEERRAYIEQQRRERAQWADKQAQKGKEE